MKKQSTMLSKNERKILRFINYLPLIVIICLISLVSIIYVHNNTIYKENINNLKESFLFENKRMIKQEVNRVYKYILYERSKSESRLKEFILSRVNEVHTIMTAIYTKYKEIESEDQIKQRIIDLLKNYRYNNTRGYFI